MNRRISVAAIGLLGLALAGCEGAVLVNNRPDHQNAAPTTQTSSSVSSDQAQPAASQDHPDVVNTKNARVESHGD